MKVSKLAVVWGLGMQLSLMLLLLDMPQTALAQDEPAFELPVQLVGFPVIILAVRLSNFVKKLAYSLSPDTYRRRTRRGIPLDDTVDAVEAEKRLVTELGRGVCIYERVCAHHALRARSQRPGGPIDWATVLSQYKRSPDRNKEFYLLSVFLGNIVGSPSLCHQLAKRGRACLPDDDWTQ